MKLLDCIMFAGLIATEGIKKTVLLSLVEAPPTFSELTVSFVETDNSIMSLLFGDVVELETIV
jgi:hypothetical protein